jgi:signal transduction histidine kinase
VMTDVTGDAVGVASAANADVEGAASSPALKRGSTYQSFSESDGRDEFLVEGDPELLRSAVENVIRNATRYTAEGTTVDVRLERQAAGDGGRGEIIVSVVDSGPGVPNEALQKIFEPFYRLDDARNRQTGGAGLGLSIADRAIRLHGGQLRASNRKEGGLEVEIRIPAASPA